MHQVGSLGSTGTLAAKTDLYRITCAKPAVVIRAALSGLTAENPAKLSIQVTKGRAVSPVSTDKANGDGVASKSAKLAKGSGVYIVKVNKAKSSMSGIAQYDAEISCLDKKKVQVGTNVVIKKNQ